MEDRIGELAEMMVLWLWGDEDELAAMLDEVGELGAIDVQALPLG